MELRILGPLQVVEDDRVVAIRGPKERALLSALALLAGDAVSSDSLIDAVWGERSPASATKLVQNQVLRLRKLLGASTIETRQGGYAIALSASAVDARRFEALVHDGRGAIARGEHAIGGARFADALSLWRGAPYAEIAGWAPADAEIARLGELRRTVEEEAIDARLALGDHTGCVADLEALVAAEPLREHRWVQLILACYRGGRQGDALRAYQRARTTLADELGVEPGPELRALERAVIAQEPSLDPQIIATGPSTLTVLFTDIEGSTALLRRLGERYTKLIEDHHRLVRDAIVANNGTLLGSAGDGTFAAFPTARQAVDAALAAQDRLATNPWPADVEVRVRMALHSGEVVDTAAGFVGLALHEVARILAGVHGGQVVISGSARGLLGADAVDGLALRDLGVHRVRDVADAVHLFQVAETERDREFPPLLFAQAELPLSLAFTTSFVGRFEELSNLDRLVDNARLITVVGPGGTGKTRLALEVARRAADRMAQIAVVELAPIIDPAAVPAAVADAVAPPSESQDPMERVIDALRSRRSLLILDNCEHVVDACAEIAGALIARCPELCILATSRHPMDVAGEKVVALAPLPIDEAVALLVDRARAVQPAFVFGPDNAEPLTDICRQVAGIPLAIELAAARLRALSAHELTGRLQVLDLAGRRSSSPRHRTLRAAIDWSHELLTPPARVLFRSLGVFAGFDLSGAAAVGSDALDDGATEVLIDELVAASMVVFEPDGGRYRLLEPLRQYAMEQLEAVGEGRSQRERHARHYLGMARRETLALLRGDFPRSRLVVELHNLDIALAWADEHDEDALLDAVGALGFFWVENAMDQGARWTERAVARTEHADPSRRALVLVAAGMAHYNASDNERWIHGLEEAVDIFRSRREPLGIAWALRWLGLYLRATDPPRARSCFEEGLAIFREFDNKAGTAWSLFALAGLADDRGEAGQAEEMRTQALELSRDVPSVRGPILSALAVSAARRGDLAMAVAQAREAVAVSGTVGSRWNQSLTLMAAAGIELQAGHREAGGAYLRDTLSLWRQYGSRELLACSLIIAAHYTLDGGDPDAAQTLLSATGWDDVGPDYPYISASLAHVRAGLAGLALDDAANRGRTLGLDAAVDEALELLSVDGVPMRPRRDRL